MQPTEPSDDRSISVPPRNDNAVPRAADRDAATNIMREQINRIYDQPQQEAAQAAPAENVYNRTHNDVTAHKDAPANGEWHRYHSAWQQYYQQYYERYYLQQVEAHRVRTLNGPATATHNQFPLEKTETVSIEETTTKDQAVHEIRDELLGKVKLHTTRVRKSRHFIPIASALVVMLLFMGLQYNRVFIAQVKAYVSPGTVSPQNIILDPTTNVKVGPEPKLIIPKINVEAPVVYGVTSLADAPVQSALKGGVVHYPIPGANSMPGQKGNTVILGHSSNDVFDDGDYKFIFVQLDKLQPGDTFYINYESTRYTYTVTKKEIIEPNEVSKLILPTDKPMATLVTCTPAGTALRRLVVYAEQISPDPAKATETVANEATSASSTTSTIPGNSPTFFDRLLGR
ncbi:sortase [Pedobacter sp.]|nr:sortase [Candidatus Saccharibacteria bacterium]